MSEYVLGFVLGWISAMVGHWLSDWAWNRWGKYGRGGTGAAGGGK